MTLYPNPYPNQLWSMDVRAYAPVSVVTFDNVKHTTIDARALDSLF